MAGKFSIPKILGWVHSENGRERAPFSELPGNFTGKINTPDEALSVIKSGDRIFLGTGCATPQTLITALERSDRALHDVEIYHFLVDGAIPLKEGVPDTRFFHKTFFVDSKMREVIKQGRGDYIPLSIADLPHLIESGALTVDVALIQVGMPDKRGFVNFGVSADITRVLVQNAKTVIAELNPNMPKTYGDTSLSVDLIDRAIVVDLPVIEFRRSPVDEAIAEQIAHNVSRIIENGSTLQIGLGPIPTEILKYLGDRRDLGIHTDVICDSIVDLIENGVVTGQKKSIHKGQIVASYCLGTKRLYDLIDDNPLFAFYPIEYVCDPSVIGKNHQMVSVTQAWAVDLMGQVCSDQFHGELWGGVSTQPNFIRGAAKSPGGKPIICLTSTTDDGTESRVRPLLREGEGVTIPRSDVHYVVTEYGSAYLFGKSIREKALALIEIAHPEFRHQLLEEAQRYGYVRRDQDLKCRADGVKTCRYPAGEEQEVTLANGTRIGIRPARTSDVRGLQELFYRLPPEDVYTRFFSGLKSFPVLTAEAFCNVDYEKEMAFVATLGQRENEKIIGSAFYVVDESKTLAEVAYMILHEWQGMGLGTLLQTRMIQYARSKGIRGFKADILPVNKAMLKLSQKCGQMASNLVDGAYEVEMLFD